MKKVAIVVTIFIIAVICGQPVTAWSGGDFTFNPTLELRGEYDDNIDFDNHDEISDWLGICIPALCFNWRTPRLEVEGTAGVEIRRYSDESEYDDEYQRYHLTSRYALTERLRLNSGASFIRDSTHDSELEETGVVVNFYRRDRYTLNGGFDYQFSERISTGINYTYTNTDYDSPTEQDYDNHSVVGHIGYVFDDGRDQGFLQPSYSHYKSDRSRVDNYGLSLGWIRTLTEKLTLTCYLGIRYTDTEYTWHGLRPVFNPGDGTISWRRVKHTETENDIGGTADISLAGNTETLEYEIGFNRDLSYTSDGSPIDRNRFKGSISWQASRRLRYAFDSSLYFSKSNDNFSKDRRRSIYEDTVYYYLHPHISYRISENHYLQFHYRYARNRDKTLSDNKSYDRNRVWLSLVLKFPKLLD